MSEAVLSEADLSGADLSEAVLDGAPERGSIRSKHHSATISDGAFGELGIRHIQHQLQTAD